VTLNKLALAWRRKRFVTWLDTRSFTRPYATLAKFGGSTAETPLRRAALQMATDRRRRLGLDDLGQGLPGQADDTPRPNPAHQRAWPSPPRAKWRREAFLAQGRLATHSNPPRRRTRANSPTPLLLSTRRSSRFPKICRGHSRRGRSLPPLRSMRRKPREVVDEIQRVLNFVSDASRQLAERSQLLGLHEAVLGGPRA
jgi:hypothetical protein